MSGTDAIGIERLEALLAGEAPLTAPEARRAALLAELRSGTLHAPEALRARVLAQRPARSRLLRPVPLPRRRALVLVPALVALALLAAAVHGIVSPSPRAAAPAATAEQLAPSVKSPVAGAPAVGDSSRAKPAPARAHGSSRASRTLGSAARFLALEGLVALALLPVAAFALALVRARRRRDERRLLGATAPRRRGDLME